MESDSPATKSWMQIDIPLSQELQLEATIREVSGHRDMQKVRDLCASLIRQNFYQQRLLSSAISHISELEALIYIGSQTSDEDMRLFVQIAHDICNELGIG